MRTGADAFQLSPCRDRLSVCLRSALLRFLSSAFILRLIHLYTNTAAIFICVGVRQAQAALMRILPVPVKGASPWDPDLVWRCGATYMF